MLMSIFGCHNLVNIKNGLWYCPIRKSIRRSLYRNLDQSSVLFKITCHPSFFYQFHKLTSITLWGLGEHICRYIVIHLKRIVEFIQVKENCNSIMKVSVVSIANKSRRFIQQTLICHSSSGLVGNGIPPLYQHPGSCHMSPQVDQPHI